MNHFLAISVLLLGGFLFTGCDLIDSAGHLKSESELFPPPDTMQAAFEYTEAAYGMFTPDNTGFIITNASESYGREVGRLYDRNSGTIVQVFKPYPAMIYLFSSMAISNDGSMLLVAGAFAGRISGGPGYPGFVIWDIKTGDVIRNSLDLATDKLPKALAFAPGDSVFVGYFGDVLVSYRIEPKRVPPTYFPELDSSSFDGQVYSTGITTLEFSPDGKSILTNSPSLWDFTTRSLTEDFDKTRSWWAPTIAYAGRWDLFICGNAAGLYVLSLDKDSPERHFPSDFKPEDSYGDDPDVLCVAVSKDGKFMASGDNLGRVKVFETATGKPVALGLTSYPIEYVSFSPDGKTVMSITAEDIQTDDRIVQIWNLLTE